MTVSYAKIPPPRRRTFALLAAALLTVAVIAPAQAAPPEVTDFSLKGQAGAILLEWSPSAGATGYKIYRWEGQHIPSSETPPVLIADLTAGTTTSWTDTGPVGNGLTPGVEYFYYIVAVDDTGESAPAIPTPASATPSGPPEEEEGEAKLEIRGPTDVRFQENGAGAVATYAVGYVGGDAAPEATLEIGTWADSHLFVLDGNDLRFVSSPDYEEPQDRQGKNVYRLHLIAATDELVARQRVRVRVTNTNREPITVPLCDRSFPAYDELRSRIQHNLYKRGLRDERESIFASCASIRRNVTRDHMNRIRLMHVSGSLGKNAFLLQADDFEDLPNLRHLVLVNGFGNDSFPDGIFVPLSNLHELDIRNNEVLTRLPGDLFRGLDELQVLHIDALLTQDSFPTDIFSNRLGKLETLDLADNSITDATDADFVAEIRKLGSLQKLALQRNQLSVPEGEDVLFHAERIACHFPDVSVGLHGNSDFNSEFGKRNQYILRTAEWCAAQLFQAQQTFDVGESPESVALGDVNADGRLDIVTANGNSDDVSVLLGDGDGTFQAQQTYDVGDHPYSVALGDVDGNDRLDIVTANQNSDDVSVRRNRGNGISFRRARHLGVGDAPYSVALGDVDGDGDLDIVTANENSDNVSVRLGRGNGSFLRQQTFGVGDSPDSVALGDVNGDGDLDIVVANAYSDDVSVRLGNGDGTFRAQQTFGVGDSPESVVLGDVNGDGNLDILTANGLSNNVSLRLGNGDGTFPVHQTFGVGAGSNSVALGDLNGDGVLDIVTANWDSHNVSVRLGDDRYWAAGR